MDIRKQILASIVVGVSALVGIGTYELLHKQIESDYRKHLDGVAQSGVMKLDEMFFDIERSVKMLNQMDTSSCDSNTLIKMRQVIFDSSFIKDIELFVGQNLVCSAGLGVFTKPVERSMPDIESVNGKVWLNEFSTLFGNTKSASIIKVGNLGLVINRVVLDHILPKRDLWELYFKENNVYRHIAGMYGVYINLSNKDITVYNPNLAYQRCSNSASYCLAVQGDYDQFLKENKPTLTSLTVMSALIAFFTVLILNNINQTYFSIESRVHRAIKKRSFGCVYQPIFDLSKDKIVGCEVLARLSDSQGEICPDVFIPIIERSGLSWDFTSEVLNNIKTDLQSVLEFPKDFKMNVNFFPSDISSGKVLSILDDEELLAIDVQLVIEITEDQQLNTVDSKKVLTSLSKSGFNIAIDDFGTGFSNLSQVHDFDCSTIKVDKSFIRHMEGGTIRSTLIPHIVDIAKKVGANVIAEGVEQQEQLEQLKSIGVEFGQGWHFGKGVPMSDFYKAYIR